MAWGALMGLGQGLQQFGNTMSENAKEELRNKLLIDEENRAEQRYLRRLNRDADRVIVDDSGRYMRQIYNNAGEVAKTEPLSAIEISNLENAQKKDKLSLDKLAAETDLLNKYGPLLKEADLRRTQSLTEASEARAAADRAREDTYSLDYQLRLDEGKQSNRAQFGTGGRSGGAGGWKVSKPVEDAYFNKEVTDDDGKVKRVRDAEAVKSYNDFVSTNNLVRDDESVRAWAAERDKEAQIRRDLEADGATPATIEEALRAIRAGEDYTIQQKASHPKPTANAVRKLWSNPEKYAERFIRDFGKAAFDEAMRRKES